MSGTSLNVSVKKMNYTPTGCDYGVVYCILVGMQNLNLGYLSQVWETCLKFEILVLSLGYLS